MSNFKFKTANGSDVSLNEITHQNIGISGNGYPLSNIGNFYPSLIFSSDGTSGRAGVTTCNNSYKIYGKDILNEGFITSGGGSGGALGAYRFFTTTTNNVDIPPWCNYLRILLIAGGGGGGGVEMGYMGGGAGQLTLVELPVSFVSNMTKYVIIVGGGGAASTGDFAAGDGGYTSFNSAGGAASAYFDAQGGHGASGNSLISGQGGGDDTRIIGPDAANPLQIYARGVDGTTTGGPGNLGKGGIGAGSPPLGPNGGIPPLVNEWDLHFGFYVGRMGEPHALVKEMANIQSIFSAYGKGGDHSSSGNNGCACVFYFPHQPPSLILP